MCPAANLGYAARSFRIGIAVQYVVAAIAIGLKVSLISGKMGGGMFAATPGCEAEGHRRRGHVAAGTAIAQIDPEIGGVAAIFAHQQGDRRLVAMDLGGLENVGQQSLAKRSHQPGQLARPAAHHITINSHALPPQDHRLAVPWLMVNEAANHQMCEQRAAGHHLGQRQIDGRRLSDRLARPASDTGPNMAQDAETGRHIIQHLGDIFADDGLHPAAATWFRAMLGREARYMRRNWRAGASLAFRF